jgi:hypothetical protein
MFVIGIPSPPNNLNTKKVEPLPKKGTYSGVEIPFFHTCSGTYNKPHHFLEFSANYSAILQSFESSWPALVANI